jgi:fatty acid desaturase
MRFDFARSTMTRQPAHSESLRTIQWRDLVPLTRWESAWELSLSVPWLFASLACYSRAERSVLWLFPGAACTFFFFLTGLRQSHNAQHYALGIGRRGQDVVLVVLSVLMMMSMHSVQVTHLIHHRHCLAEGDVEAAHAKEPWWRVLLCGPLFPVRLVLAAVRHGSPAKRRWIVAELFLMVAWLLIVFFVLRVPALKWHVAAVMTGESFTAFFAVWTVHHGCDEQHTIARTQRGWMKNLVSYSMFYHLEHHLFPAVPTSHLPKLARRLDQAIPNFSERQVW